jgi:hypothetical protein
VCVSSLVVAFGCLAERLTHTLRRCPYHREVLSAAEPLEAVGHALLDVPQVLLGGSLSAKRQEARLGAKGTAAPAETDYTVIIGPLCVARIWGRALAILLMCRQIRAR